VEVAGSGRQLGMSLDPTDDSIVSLIEHDVLVV
jgi:hypothetical protein